MAIISTAIDLLGKESVLALAPPKRWDAYTQWHVNCFVSEFPGVVNSVFMFIMTWENGNNAPSPWMAIDHRLALIGCKNRLLVRRPRMLYGVFLHCISFSQRLCSRLFDCSASEISFLNGQLKGAASVSPQIITHNQFCRMFLFHS